MNPASLSRRGFLKESIVRTAPLMVAASSLPGFGAEPGARADHRITVVCIGAHPDDPESGCAGTLARYAEAGHSVSIVYLTRGERGIRNASLDDAAKVRTSECEAACKIIGAKPVFFGQIDGATEVNKRQVDAMTEVLSAEKPDVVFTHWPVDSHMDHQVASFLAIRACMALGERQHLYFFEVNTGDQSRGFLPNTYVDISSVVEKKKSALFAHVSQDGREIWRRHHEVVATWRGREAGVAAAEAFVHLNRDSALSGLPAV